MGHSVDTIRGENLKIIFIVNWTLPSFSFSGQIGIFVTIFNYFFIIGVYSWTCRLQSFVLHMYAVFVDGSDLKLIFGL